MHGGSATVPLCNARSPIAISDPSVFHRYAHSRSTDPNRRVRTRTHGGVGGVGPRGLPLSRFAFGFVLYVLAGRPRREQTPPRVSFTPRGFFGPFFRPTPRPNAQPHSSLQYRCQSPNSNGAAPSRSSPTLTRARPR